jgi:hypothetical protein
MAVTASADAFLGRMHPPHSERILLLAALVAHDEGRSIIRIGDLLLAYQAWAEIPPNSPIWEAVEKRALREWEDDDGIRVR